MLRNVQHMGAAKTWYGVPADSADAFEEVALGQMYGQAVAAAQAGGASQEAALDRARRHLLRKTSMFSPRLLTEAGRSRGTLCPHACTQRPGSPTGAGVPRIRYRDC